GAVAGTGFIIKAAVALLAAAAAPGLGGARGNRAVAAPDAHVPTAASRTVAAAASSHVTAAKTQRRAVRVTSRAHGAVRPPHRAGSVATSVSLGRPAVR